MNVTYCVDFLFKFGTLKDLNFILFNKVCFPFTSSLQMKRLTTTELPSLQRIFVLEDLETYESTSKRNHVGFSCWYAVRAIGE